MCDSMLKELEDKEANLLRNEYKKPEKQKGTNYNIKAASTSKI